MSPSDKIKDKKWHKEDLSVSHFCVQMWGAWEYFCYDVSGSEPLKNTAADFIWILTKHKQTYPNMTRKDQMIQTGRVQLIKQTGKYKARCKKYILTWHTIYNDWVKLWAFKPCERALEIIGGICLRMDLQRGWPEKWCVKVMLWIMGGVVHFFSVRMCVWNFQVHVLSV